MDLTHAMQRTIICAAVLVVIGLAFAWLYLSVPH